MGRTLTGAGTAARRLLVAAGNGGGRVGHVRRDEDPAGPGRRGAAVRADPRGRS
jgi:hypothetical protein